MESSIKPLNPGDEVVVFTYLGKRIEKVKSISPSGRVILQNGTVYNPDGRERGASVYHSSSIGILTDEIREDILRGQMIYRLHNTDFSGLTNDKLRAIVEILEVKKED